MVEQIRLDSEKYADEQMKDVYSNQKDKLNELHSFIGLLYIKYSVDGMLKFNNSQKASVMAQIDDKLKGMGKDLGQKEVSKVKGILDKTYKDTYCKNAYVLDSGMDVDIKFKMPKQEFIDSAVNAKFKEETFSSRIWNNKAAMIDKLKDSIAEASKGNTTIDKIAKDIQHTFNVSAYDSNRLVSTETARVAVKAQEQIGLDSGCKEVMWSATLDSRTAPHDASLDGKVWGINENHPEPVIDTHPRCRCVLINVPFADWKPTKRKDNETKDIIDYKDYKQWLNNSKSDIIPTGAISPDDFKRRDKHAELYYEEIRNRKSDISTIAKNTGWDIEKIDAVKHHVFLDKHLLNGEMQRFASDYDMAQAWQRLIDGNNIKDSDLILLNHEYEELTQMKVHNYDYRTAHKVANKKYNWWSMITGDD
ncbi:minor capsid protein [Clostridium sp. AWRP]|uniref:minor capsid protein n=1 Tax=Clostridium sp. AWRP TaxID=2212991 RepID=UPI001585ECFC|nr:minor capsid protein [Clostridium sp. AWRP]